MRLPPFTFWSISLWLAVTAILLLITAQLASSYDGPATLLIDTKKLKQTAIILGLLFLVTVAIQIYQTIITS
jgi:hypothetical protein